MDIDLSKVALIVLAVLPGYLARRGSDRVIPRTQRKMGATEEVAEFLIYSVAAHLVLAALYCACWTIGALIQHHAALFYIGCWLKLSPALLFENLSTIPTPWLALHLVLSLCLGWLMGLVRGLLSAWHSFDAIAQRLGILNTRFGRWWSQYIERFLITDRPIAYDAMFPDPDENGNPKEVFLAVIMKGDSATITGRVSSFSIANDEESHKLVYLVDVYRKPASNLEYQKLDADGMLLDLADALIVQIKQA